MYKFNSCWRILVLKSIRFLIVLSTFFALPANALVECPVKSGQSRVCSVLLVHSYHPGLEWVKVLSENFSSTLTDRAEVRIDTEYLDAKRHPSLEHANTFLQILRMKYKAYPPDVVVISDDPAFNLLWPLREELFAGIPIVFMGLNGQRDDLSAGLPGLTGILEQHATEKTVELALKLTKANGIIVLNDTSETGIANELKLKEVVDTNPGVEWVVKRDLSVEDIDQITSLPNDWPVITMLPLRESRLDGAMLSQRQSVELLRRSIPNPLFYDSEWMMGSGLVGGHALSGTDHGMQAGELVIEVLRGVPPEKLAVRSDTKHQWIFDQRELNRFGWSHDLLPPNAVYQYAEINFWERHQRVILPMLFALAVAALIIIMQGVTVNRQRKAEALLRQQEERLSAALAASHAGVFEIRPTWSYASPRWLELIDSDSDKHSKHLAEDWMRHATPDSRNLFEKALKRLAGDSDWERIELNIANERPRILSVLLTSGRSNVNYPGAIIGVATDITTTRLFEEKAARRNRLEILGKLAGGIAHDLNNFLLVIKVNAEMAKQLDDPNHLKKMIDEIEDAGDRANDTVRQLLSFGSHDPQAEKVIDMNEAIHRTNPFLQRMIGLNGKCIVTLHDEPLGVRIDRGQIERVLWNLVVNARDAMLNGGAIHLEVGVKTIDFIEYVIVTVRDEGHGMDAATRDRIFEPFFTTKAVDEGTGLGLSTVYGIVNGSGGEITVTSKLGVGTTFELAWPREPSVGSTVPDTVVHSDKRGEAAILLVEDDPTVGRVAQRLLEDAGFYVGLAENGKAGLEAFSESPQKWDLVLSDIVLPELNGIEMAAEIQRLNPSAKVGFLSGFVNHSSLFGAQLPSDAQLLKKPFARKELYAFVDNLLNSTVTPQELTSTRIIEDIAS